MNIVKYKMLYVSLTCLPTRIDNIEYIFEWLLEQTMKPDKLIIHLPKKCIRLNMEYNIELIQEKIKAHPLHDKVYLNITKDYGPITKIYPLIHLDFIKDEDMLIILDDDNYYNPYLIETLVETFKGNGEKHAICVSGLRYPTELNSKYLCILPGHICNIMEGAFGYIIKRSFLKEDLTDWVIDVDSELEINLNHYTYSFVSDDYVISRYLDKHGILKFVLPPDDNIHKDTCFVNKNMKNDNALSAVGHNLNGYVYSEIELKNKGLI